MKIRRKKNGLYQIDDISLEDMTRICTVYNVGVNIAESNRGVSIPELQLLGAEFEKEIENAINE